MSSKIDWRQVHKLREGLGVYPLPVMLDRSVERHFNRLAVRKRSQSGEFYTYTYEEFVRLVKKLAKFLKEEFKIKKGDFVAIIGENRPEWMISYFAVHWIGGIVVPLDSRAKPTEIRHIIQHSGTEVVIASGRYIDTILEVKEQCRKKTIKKILVMDIFEDFPNLPHIFQTYPEISQMDHRELDDVAVILYTSGTTGSSKGVMLTHRNLSSNVDQMYRFLEASYKDRFFSVLPIHHVYENTAGNLVPLFIGASITYARSLKPRLLFEDLKDTEPTVFLVVPLLLEKILLGIYRKIEKAPLYKKALFELLKGSAELINRLKPKKGSEIIFKSLREQMGLGKLKYLISGGAALPRWVAEGFEALGFPLIQGYGLSETSPVLTLNPPCCPKNWTVGVPLPDVELKIKDPDEEGIGEIAVKGPNIMKGYFRNPEATAKVFDEEGFFLTGDLGFIDEDGYLQITGRKKSVIVTKGGKNVFPEEVENVLLQSPYIEEILVLRGFNPKTGAEEVHAIVYPNMEKLDEYFSKKGIVNPSEKDIYELIKREIDKYGSQLAEYKRVKHFTLRDEEFPKTTTNKIKRYLFEQQRF